MNIPPNTIRIPYYQEKCALHYLGCEFPKKLHYQTCSKLCGEIKLILEHKGAIPVICLENGQCGLKNFGCNIPTVKNSKTGQYYPGCNFQHTEIVKRILMTGRVAIITKTTIEKSLKNGIKKAHSSAWTNCHKPKPVKELYFHGKCATV